MTSFLKPALLVFARWTQAVCLAVWLGGIIGIGALVAPVAFRHSGLTPDQAGAVVGGSLIRFNALAVVLLALQFAMQGVESWSLRPACLSPRRVAWSRAALSLLLLALAVTLDATLAPAMTRLQAEGQMERFRDLHRSYALLTQIQVACALAILGLNLLLNRPGPTGVLSPKTTPLDGCEASDTPASRR